MPIYEYICQSCGENFEKIVLTASSTTQIICPHCKSENLKKNMSTTSYRLASSSSAMPACGKAGGCPSAGSGFS